MIFTILHFYLLVINCFTYLAFAYDKYQAKTAGYRIPERVLMLLAFIGGGFGGLLAMVFHHHKTRKSKFALGVPFAIIVNIGEYMLVFNSYWFFVDLFN